MWVKAVEPTNGERGIVRTVGQLVDEEGQFRQPGKVRHRSHPHLGLEAGDQRGEIAVAGPLPVAVDRPLHLHRARAHGGQRVRHPEPAIVVRVDAERGRREVGGGGAKDRLDLVGQAAAVRVAEDDQVRPALPGGVQRRQRMFGVVLVAVEEMFRVVDDLAAMAFEVAHAVGDHRAVLRRVDPQHFRDVEPPAFAEDRHHGSPGPEQAGDLRVLADRHVRAARAAKGGELGAPEGLLLGGIEKRGVLGV